MRFSKAQSVAVSAFGHVQRFGRVLLGVCVLAFLATFLISVHSRPTSATGSAGPSVTIANTPLPVTGNINATVSGPVTITGIPSVNASQSGPWTVGISGTPTVNVGNSGPLPVTVSGDPSSSAFTPVAGTKGSNTFETNACFVNFTNPASIGQILVIENIGATVGLASGQKVTSMQINGQSQQDEWVPTYQFDDGSTAYFGASQPMRLYFRAGDNPGMAALVNNLTPSGYCVFSYTGYVLNVH